MNTKFFKRIFDICCDIVTDVNETIKTDSVRIQYIKETGEYGIVLDTWNVLCVLKPSYNRTDSIKYFSDNRCYYFSTSVSEEITIEHTNISLLNDDELFQFSIAQPIANEIEYFRKLNSVLNPYAITIYKQYLTEEILNSIENVISEYNIN